MGLGGVRISMSTKLVNVDRHTPMLLPLDRSEADLEAKAPSTPPPAGAAMGELMRYRLKTPEGQRLSRLRKQTVG